MKADMKAVIFDCDGVLADFSLGFTSLARELFGNRVALRTSQTQARWDFTDIMPPMDVNSVWDAIEASDSFWQDLVPCVGGEIFFRISALSLVRPVYFVSARSQGPNTKQQTEAWLNRQGVERPTVVISSSKGSVAAGVNAEFVIEDMPEFLWDIRGKLGDFRGFLLNRIYNMGKDIPACSVRVNSVDEFLTIVESST